MALRRHGRRPHRGQPIGLLAALLGVQRGLDVQVLDRVTHGPEPSLVADLGAAYHTGAMTDLPRPTSSSSALAHLLSYSMRSNETPTPA